MDDRIRMITLAKMQHVLGGEKYKSKGAENIAYFPVAFRSDVSSEREWKGRESCQGGEIGFDGYLLDNYLPVGAGGKRVVLR